MVTSMIGFWATLQGAADDGSVPTNTLLMLACGGVVLVAVAVLSRGARVACLGGVGGLLVGVLLALAVAAGLATA